MHGICSCVSKLFAVLLPILRKSLKWIRWVHRCRTTEIFALTDSETMTSHHQEGAYYSISRKWHQHDDVYSNFHWQISYVSYKAEARVSSPHCSFACLYPTNFLCSFWSLSRSRSFFNSGHYKMDEFSASQVDLYMWLEVILRMPHSIVCFQLFPALKMN